jgi:hypothetical protein
MKACVCTMVILCACAMAFVVHAGSEKQEIPPFSASVKLEITGNELQNDIYSYISRELRSLGDVKIVNDQEEWTIQIVALQEHAKTDRIVGIAISSVVLKHIWSEPALMSLLSQAKEKLSESGYNLLAYSLLAGCTVSNHKLLSGSPEDLQSLCKNIVVDFDADCLKPARELHQRVIESLKETREQKKQGD